MDGDKLDEFAENCKSALSNGYILVNRPKNGIKHKNSHINKKSGRPKIAYSSIEANMEAMRMTATTGEDYVSYKCPQGDGYHIGHGSGFIHVLLHLCDFTTNAIKLFKTK